MPISMDKYASPKWTKQRTRYPFVQDRNYRYKYRNNPKINVERLAGRGWKPPGYNPNHNSITTEKVTVDVDTSSRSFKPY